MENIVSGNGVGSGLVSPQLINPSLIAPDIARYGSMIAVAAVSPVPAQKVEAAGKETAPVADTSCPDSDYFREQAVKAAEQMTVATLSFLRYLVASKSEQAATSFAEMRAAMIRCSAAGNVWSQHLTDHGCK